MPNVTSKIVTNNNIINSFFNKLKYINKLNKCLIFPDDITVTADGIDTYHLVKKAGRYR